MTLPTPDPAFDWSAEAWGHALRCRPLTSIAQHAFTTRQLPLRLPASQGQPPDHDAYQLAWTQAAATVGAGLEQVMRVKQVHGAQVRVLKKGETGPGDVADKPEADALVSNAPGLVLTVQVADCVPILLADRKTKAVAAVHAGWRGTCAGVARRAVETMVREFETNPADLVAAIGPSIGPCCYEVGMNVVEAFQLVGATTEQIERWFQHAETGSIRLDLWAANRDQLMAVGLRDGDIHTARLCTQTHRDVFDSYRADGDRAGRMAGLIAVPT